ncbi:SLAM family member 8 [Sarotherodon galilaeus]
MEDTHPFERFIDFYFELGLNYKDIKTVLCSRHSFHISERHLKRVLSTRGHTRHKAYSDLAVLVEFIDNQLQYSGQLHGYRWMYTKCREHGLRVRKEDVCLVLKELDPRGVALRQARRFRRRNYFSKGPNFIWHMDSYDKLKPYGICINGSIDGFSRKIIWLNAYTTNSNPKVIGGYYIEAVQRLKGCPRVVRGDLGTENGHVRGFQRFLVPVAPNDTLESYLEGASTANQRIEYWWRFLRSQCLEFWLSLFADIRDNGYFDGGFLDKNLLQFCCMGLIQDELDDTAQVWNAHSIRPSTNINIPSGRPNVMYTLPELYGTRDFLCPTEEEHVEMCKTECVFRLTKPCDPDVYELCNILMTESHLTPPTDPYQAVNLYVHLRENIVALV